MVSVLSRRELLAASSALAYAPTAAAAAAADVQIRYRDYSHVLPGYLTRLAADAYARRNAALASTPLAQRQKWVRETFWNLVGGPPPERTPLNTRTTGSFERAGYRVEKLIYESRPGFHVPANLYIPNRQAQQGRTAPFPGVLFQMGHTLNGKAGNLYQYCCQGLVQLGFVVLAFDPMGQGERTYYPRADASNLTRLDSADTEHTLPGKQLILAGDSSTRLQTWDAVRSLDLLASHPLVDPKRLASTGNSGGGTLTMLLMAVDDRLACASVACGNTENVACANYNPPGSTDDAEQDFLFGGPVGFDRWDTVWPMAPKPLQFLVSAKDSQGTYSPRYLENGREEFARLAKVYASAGRAANLEWIESPLPHGLSYDSRMHIYRWFRLHLQGIAAPLADEPPVNAELDRTLYATESGNTVRDLGSFTPRQLAVARLNEKAVIPAKLPAPAIIGRRAKLGETQSRHVRIEAWEIESEAQVFLPAWAFFPKASPAKATLVLLEPGGRNAQWNEESLSQQLAAAGIAVISPDVRGIGDLRPEFPRQNPGHAHSHQAEEAFAWASLILGRPLLDQRITDVRSVLKAASGTSRLYLAARGVMTVPALHALLAEPGVSRAYLSGGLSSYRALVDQEEPRYPLAHLEFGVLQNGGADIPALLERAGARAGTGQTWDLSTLAALVG